MALDPHCNRVLAMMQAGPAPPQNMADRRQSLVDLARLAGDDGPNGVAVEDFGLPTPDGVLAVRSYLAEAAAKPAPALVYLHGGGWVAGSVDTHDGVCRALAASSGCRVFSVDYRLAPEHPFPAALTDAISVLRWTREKAAALNIDPARVVIGGDSAGANIAVAAAVEATAQGIALARQLLICPILDPGRSDGSRAAFAEGHFIDFGIYRGDLAAYLSGHASLDDPRISAPRITDPAALPPASIHVAEYDPFRDEGLAYADRLNRSGVDASATVHTGMIHYFYALPRLVPYARVALAEIGRELARDLA